ncbi:hypothetical protein ACFQT0_15735 [Hymenobacter humi]|uniref:DUF4292 domain-containing protein n=1 Tax=Hymenobacter humi TaxID=1411620 RepID=A0ABW2U8K2_9BACT
MASIPEDGASITNLLEAKPFLADVAITPRDGKLFALMAADFGTSSPLVRGQPRVMEIYSRDSAASGWKRESQLNAFAITGRLNLDPTRPLAFLNLMFHHQYDPHGPYQFDLVSKELTSLVPVNMAQLQPSIAKSKAAKSFLLDDLKAVPSKVMNGYFLYSNYTVYQVDGQSGRAEIHYPKAGDEKSNVRYYVLNVSTLHRSNGIVMVLKRNSNLFIRTIQENGHQRELPLDMTPYLQDF